MIPFRQFKMRRGLKAQLPVLSDGELGWCEDTQELYIGTDVAVNVRIFPSGGASSLNWSKYTKTYADLAAAALTNDIQLFQLPTAGVIHGAVIHHTQSFAGGLITGYTLSLGIMGDLTKYASAFDVFQAPGNTTFQNDLVLGLENLGAPTSIRLAATAVGANLDQATAGSVDIWVLTSSLP